MQPDTINDPRFMNAYMIVANSIKMTAENKSVALATGEAHEMARTLLLALKRSGYVLRKEKVA